MSPIPKDQKLYEKVKQKVYEKIPKHSAYRSGILVKTYKSDFAKKYGENTSPYIGEKPGRTDGGLRRWFAEEWKNQRGEVGYKTAHDVYRPTKRISKKTPTTFGELTRREILLAEKKKEKKGRVDRFKI